MPRIESQPGQLVTRQRVDKAIASAAAKTGVDFDYLVNQARVESNFNPGARAKTSSATGLYQFTRQTWLATVKEHGGNHSLGWAADAISKDTNGTYRVTEPGLRETIYDLRLQPEAAASMAAEFASDNQDNLNAKLGGNVESVDLYLAHFLGANGAAKFLEAYKRNPEISGASILPNAAAANRSIFYNKQGEARSLFEIRQNFSEDFNSTTSFPSRFDQASSIAHNTLPPDFSVQMSASPKRKSFDSAEIREFPQTRLIEPMPKRLSLDFARKSYERLASMDIRSAAQ
jgi:Transglycosylase SLT domain